MNKYEQLLEAIEFKKNATISLKTTMESSGLMGEKDAELAAQAVVDEFYNDLTRETVAFYQRILTEEEVDRLIAAYRDPVMKSAIDKQMASVGDLARTFTFILTSNPVRTNRVIEKIMKISL